MRFSPGPGDRSDPLTNWPLCLFYDLSACLRPGDNTPEPGKRSDLIGAFEFSTLSVLSAALPGSGSWILGSRRKVKTWQSKIEPTGWL